VCKSFYSVGLEVWGLPVTEFGHGEKRCEKIGRYVSACEVTLLHDKAKSMRGSSLSRWLTLLAFGILGFCSNRLMAVEIIWGPKAESAVTSAMVRWKTDVECGSRMKFGVAPDALDHKAETPGVTTDHTVKLEALQPGTTYFFSVGTARLQLATGSLRTIERPGSAGPAPPGMAEEKSDGRKTKDRSAPPAATTAKTPPLSKIWGNPSSLPDHFARHGGDFGAKNPAEYARMAWEFLQRAKRDGLPAKYDDGDGTLRVWDPKTRTFAAYHRDGRAKTFFKPDSRGYFDRQPGKSVKLSGERLQD
jgi:hypothetical protein